MRAFAAATDRVVEVFVTSEDRMVPHGTALDPILADRDDGDWFCFIDVDIKATGPFVMDLAARMTDADAVTSGREVWTDSNVLPDGDIGLGGRHLYAGDGYVFGSPHVSIYRRDLLRETLEKWGIDLHCGREGTSCHRGPLGVPRRLRHIPSGARDSLELVDRAG